MMTTGRVFAMYPALAVPARHRQTQTLPPDIFPFPSTRLALALALPSPLPRYLGIQSWIVISSPFPSLFFSCLGHKFPPLSSDYFFHIPFPMSRPTTHRTRRPNVTNHIIRSHLRSKHPRPPIFHMGSCFVLPSPRLKTFNSPRFSPLASLSPLRAPRTQTVAHPCAQDTANHHRPLTCHAFSVRCTDSSDRFKPGLPDSLLFRCTC